MNDSMSPEELAWAYQNAGRPPVARRTTSEDFAAKARATEKAYRRDLERQQYLQDLQYNQAIHGQDMAAARAQHRALMGQYSLIDQVRGELGAMEDTSGWVRGLVTGLIVGSVLGAMFWGKRKRR